MKNFRQALTVVTVIAVAVLSLAGCKKYSYQSFEGDPTGARIYTLDNGLTIYTIVNKDRPRIDAQIAVKVGSKNDPRETTGLAHYFEHLMFKGTKQFGTQNYELEEPLLDQIEALFEQYRVTVDEAERKAIYHRIDSISYEASKIAIPNEYDKLMASLGASGTNAYTSYDVTCYVENIPSNQIENWAKIQADRFENCVLRGFHTELETIYEEYNMYAARDDQKASNALFEGLFKNHPYNTDVIGLPGHLKNPSITNVKNYHDQWYVPNNMAVVLSGDFDPDKAVKIVAKYFGKMKPNENLKRPVFEPEAPITEPVVKNVLGNESPSVMLAWRFPGANDENSVILDLIGRILFNGRAGLIDLDVNQQQKTLGMYAMFESLADYSAFVVSAEPKAGQSLDEVVDIFNAELDKVKAGDFDDDLLESIVNNVKLSFMRSIESTGSMARTAVNCFINDESWEDAVVNYADKLSAVTKADIVAFVNKNFKDNYVRVNKLQQKDPSDFSISKPQITPIFTNRDTASAFLREMQAAAAAVKPIEPSFVDFDRDLSKLEAKSGIPVLYKKNETNGIFQLSFTFESGSYADNVLPYAFEYFDYLGTDDLSAEDINKAFYKLACSYSVSCSGKKTFVSLSGLSENMGEALELLEKVISGVKASPEALALLKGNLLQSRINAKHDQSSNFSALSSYGYYGPKNPSNTTLSNAQIAALRDDDLLDRIHGLFSRQHEILYYGPLSEDEFIGTINAKHNVPGQLAAVEKVEPFSYQPVDKDEVYVAPYDANQLQLLSVSNTGETFDPDKVAIAALYNSYFGSGMNSIVFQEMREARGLAYSAGASYSTPSNLKDPYIFIDRINTQNDKLIDALDAFDEIINNMPVSEAAFKIAKESLILNLRTQRTVKNAVLNAYVSARERGLDYDINKKVFEQIQGYTLDDVVAFQQNVIKDRKYKIMILGRKSDLDFEALKRFGEIHQLSTEDIFGY